MKRSILIFLLALASAAGLAAHPHLLIMTELEPEFSGTECTGLWIEWAFADMFGASILHDFDKDKNGVFNAAETKAVHDNAFINLRKYGYFVFLRKGETRKNPAAVESFTVFLRDKRLHYRFRVPLKGLGYADDFSVAIFDSTYFCATKYKDAPVKFPAGGSGKKPIYEIVENKKYPVYYDPYGSATDTTTYTKWKPGLQTAYPTEIRFFFPK